MKNSTYISILIDRKMVVIKEVFETKNILTMTAANKWITITVIYRTLICIEGETNIDHI
jgi:hypothetical protein